MKEKRVYKKNYTEKQLSKYNKLAADIRENSFDYVEKNNGDVPKVKYLTFDGKFLTRISFDLSKIYLRSGYRYIPEITIEHLGENAENTEEKSKIEQILLDAGFKTA